MLLESRSKTPAKNRAFLTFLFRKLTLWYCSKKCKIVFLLWLKTLKPTRRTTTRSRSWLKKLRKS